MFNKLISVFVFPFFLLISMNGLAHYPILDCRYIKDKDVPVVECLAGFSDRSIASNITMEVYSEDDEIVAQGKTDDAALYRFEPQSDIFFIIMDAGPGHVVEISDEDVAH